MTGSLLAAGISFVMLRRALQLVLLVIVLRLLRIWSSFSVTVLEAASGKKIMRFYAIGYPALTYLRIVVEGLAERLLVRYICVSNLSFHDSCPAFPSKLSNVISRRIILLI
jgi:hypothetical protein